MARACVRVLHPMVGTVGNRLMITDEYLSIRGTMDISYLIQCPWDTDSQLPTDGLQILQNEILMMAATLHNGAWIKDTISIRRDTNDCGMWHHCGSPL